MRNRPENRFSSFRRMHYNFSGCVSSFERAIFRSDKLTGAEHYRFWRAAFRPCFAKPLVHICPLCPSGFIFAWTKICSVKTARHLSAMFFEGFSAFFGENGLSPIKTKKAESTERAHWQTIGFGSRQLKQQISGNTLCITGDFCEVWAEKSRSKPVSHYPCPLFRAKYMRWR